MTFYLWLCAQTARQDTVGEFARFAQRDKVFPRDARKLNLFLLRYTGMPMQRESVKQAHREWRQWRRSQGLAV